MFIQNNTEILFLNNYADNVGGVIFVHNVPAFDFLFYVLINCSVMLLSNDDYRGLTTNITLIFTNNTGRNGGDVMYGMNLHVCSKHRSLSDIVAGRSQGLDGVHVLVDTLGNNTFSVFF